MLATLRVAAQLSSLSGTYSLMRHGSVPSAGTQPPLRIMSFGDSITVFACATNGYTSAADHTIFNPLNETSGQNDHGTGYPYPTGTFFVTAHGGYRGYLGHALAGDEGSAIGPTASAPAWSFVGSQFDCGNHEGYGGETVGWLANRTTAIMTNAQPDIVLFMAGTNDFFWPIDDPHHGCRTAACLTARLRTLLDLTFAAVPKTTFLLSTITHINEARCKFYDTAHWHPGNCPSDMQANIIAYNKMLPAIAAQYVAKGFDMAVHDVNAEAQFVDADYWIWGIHFNATGFRKMANSWSKAIKSSTKWTDRAAAVCPCPARKPVPSCCTHKTDDDVGSKPPASAFSIIEPASKKALVLAAPQASGAMDVGQRPPAGGIAWNPGEQIPGPKDVASVSSWLTSMEEWRAAVRNGSWYTGAAFEDPQLRWTQTSYIQPQMHPYDRLFFDPTLGPMGNYTVQKWLDDVNVRYGGVDSILMWPTYTNIGIDDRSQYDLFEAMPGGVAGVRRVIDELHAAGVKVLIPYNPWDAGTLRCRAGGATCGGNVNLTTETARNHSYCDGPATAANPGFCDARIMDSLIKDMNADGFNGDTMGKVPEEFYSVSVALNHSVAIEPEGGGNVVTPVLGSADGSANWDTMGWGYWKYPFVPSVDSWKWMDSRRMTNICERWAKNHTNALQYALFNGDGFESWENVWGTWVGITPRDGEQIRRVGALLRFLGGRGYLLSQGWIPHSPTTDPANLFASFWPSESGDHSAAWTLVNRRLTQHSGPTLRNVTATATPGMKYFDLYNGVEVQPSGGVLPLAVERFGAVLMTSKGPDVDPELKAFLAKMAAYAKIPLASLDATWKYEYGSRVPIARADSPGSTQGMVKISGGPFRFQVRGIEIEGSGSVGNPSDIHVNPFGVDFQYEWEGQPSRYHMQWLDLPEYFLDITPVTQGAFAAYLAKDPSALSADRYHYLKNWDWSDSNAPKPFAANATLPVTYVGMAEARAYCRSVGKRLPHEEEWQFAATGGDSMQPYPWGYSPPNTTTTPQQRTGTVFPGPEHVGKYPDGASPFGILDMIGNVWQMTDEYQDTHTRSAIMKGGSNYRPSSSKWYFPQTVGSCADGHCGMTTNLIHNKYFLMNSRYERAGTVGFRCAADVAGSDQLDCEDQAVCGKFSAPLADVQLPRSQEWAVWSGASTVRSSAGGNRISDAVSGAPGAALTACNGTQSTFTWANGSTTSGACVANGTHGILFNVSAGHGATGERSLLSIYAGSTGAASMVTATLVDGAKTTVFREHVTPIAVDISNKATYNLRWELNFTTTSPSAVLMVNVSAPSVPAAPTPPPPPTPMPAACTRIMCGAVTRHSGDVSLSSHGPSDWTHYGLGDSRTTVNRKCKVGALIRPLILIGAGSAFANCPQTFSWTGGGFEAGASSEAKLGAVASTPTAIFSSGKVGGPPGGFVFTVDVPAVQTASSVYLFIGAYGNRGVLSTKLLGAAGVVEASYNYTMVPGDTKQGQWTAVATLTIPPSSSLTGTPRQRVLTGTWDQDASDAKTRNRNIQFQAIAVDAGGPRGAGAGLVCTHGSGNLAGGQVVLQAATLK